MPGCRAGDQCPYRHVLKPGVTDTDNTTPSDAATLSVKDGTTRLTSPSSSSQHQEDQQTRRLPSGPKSRAVVSKPVSTLQQKDPREFQITQVVRRFSPSREEGPAGTTLTLRIQPSDPDFPFELDALDLALIVPTLFPKDGKPTIQVQSKGIPRGFQINIERGFDTLCSNTPQKSLLQLLNDLDRHLEGFLTAEKAQTIKIIANRGKVGSPPAPAPVAASVAATVPGAAPIIPIATQLPVFDWTNEQKAGARAKRDAETRQLEARMNRVPLFSVSKDGVTFNIPLQIPKIERLPFALRPLKELTLIVPALYDLQPCRIKLKGVPSAEAAQVEDAFQKRASDYRNLTLMSHINYLTQNVHTMAILTASTANVDNDTKQTELDDGEQVVDNVAQIPDDLEEGVVDEDRPHLRFISRPPPEWTRQPEHNDSDSETSDEYDSDDFSTDASDGAQSQAGGAAIPNSAPAASPEKGILVSFPQLELHGIEILELRDISVTVKCDRCKEALDIKNIKAGELTSNSTRTESCNKCASPFSVSYRGEPMHVNSIKAGHLDLEGCTIVDLLPSHFLPTCAECSTTQPLPGIVSVRGESPMAVCRECHHRLNFKIPEVKFLRVSTNDRRLNLPLRSKRKKENLGITAGTELPERGRCKHYAKSYRWFRFSCCNRVYPCDRCHDEKEEHPNEHANRMICGWCSREQNYRPEDCHACGRSVIRKTGGGFWEGGKGTRDKRKMNRNDPRKYKRIGGTSKSNDK